MLINIKTNAKQKVIAAAQELMTVRGYSATTVDDIIKLAGVAKGSFYHAFKSKEELAIAALEDYVKKGEAIVANGPYVNIEDPVERALAFIKFIEEKSHELWAHGCLLGSISIEVADSYPGVIKCIDELFDQFEHEIESLLSPALKARGVAGVSGRELSIHFLAVIEGSIITAKSHCNPHLLQDGIARFRHYLSLLLTVEPIG
jgi:TetR/AcrR family transcriptional regulator, transcriptional repressor for nem operon